MKKAECDALRFFFAHILDQRGVLYERLELRRLDHRHLRAGIGTGHPDRGRLSCGVSDVSGGVSAHRLRDRLFAEEEVAYEDRGIEVSAVPAGPAVQHFRDQGITVPARSYGRGTTEK